jgi:hypothetical protein
MDFVHFEYDEKSELEQAQNRIAQITGFENKVFALFRNWTDHARNSFPGWEPEVLHEQHLVEEVADCIKKSLIDLWKETPEEKISTGWSVGYLSGHTQGSLSVQWSISYLPKPPLYEDVLWLKSMRQYLEIAREPATHINRLFYILKATNKLFSHPETDESEYVDFYRTMADIDFEKNHRKMIDFLSRLEEKFIYQFVEEMPNIRIPGFKKILTYEDFTYILNK